MCLDMLAQGAGICVALEAPCHLAAVRLLNVMGAGVLEAVTRVRIPFAAAFIWADVWFFSWGRKKVTGKEEKVYQMITINK